MTQEMLPSLRLKLQHATKLMDWGTSGYGLYINKSIVAWIGTRDENGDYWVMVENQGRQIALKSVPELAEVSTEENARAERTRLKGLIEQVDKEGEPWPSPQSQ